MTPGLLIIGTDTGVGKTLVSVSIVKALVAEGFRVGVLKPVATGASLLATRIYSEDAERLRTALGTDVPLDRINPLLYRKPLAPPVAARIEGHPLYEAKLDRIVGEALDWWSERVDLMVVEGIGGFLCPLTETTTAADLAVKLDFPLVVVARRALGTLSQTLLTIEAARARELRLAGIVLNSAEPETDGLAESTNAMELARRLPGIAILAEVPYHEEETLSAQVHAVNWFKMARRSRMLRSTRTSLRSVAETGPHSDSEPEGTSNHA